MGDTEFMHKSLTTVWSCHLPVTLSIIPFCASLSIPVTSRITRFMYLLTYAFLSCFYKVLSPVFQTYCMQTAKNESDKDPVFLDPVF